MATLSPVPGALCPLLATGPAWPLLEVTNPNSWVEGEPSRIDPTSHTPAPTSRVLLLSPKRCCPEGLGSSAREGLEAPAQWAGVA